MPVDRLFHPRAGHSRKIAALSDLEFRVWWTYELAADDYGVMRRSAVVLQAANDSLARRSLKAVDRALDRLVEVGLIVPFEHQGEWFVCQLDWQDFQKVRYPRESHQPTPIPEILRQCSESTRALSAQRFRKPTESDPGLPHARTREEANANGLRQTQAANANGPTRFPRDGVMAGQLPRDHVTHVFCNDAFSCCVPTAVHSKLVNLLAPRHGGDRAATGDELKAWYPTVAASLVPDFIMGDAFKFWQGRFDAVFATPTEPVRRGTAAPELTAEADIWECQHEPRCGNRSTCAIVAARGKRAS